MFLTPFQIEQLDDDHFMLLSDLDFISEKYGLQISVPRRFVSDGPSLRRYPILYAIFGNKGKRAAVIHDWLYRNGVIRRSVADGVFKEALQKSNKGWFTSWGMYLGVRIFGWLYYKKRPGCLDVRVECDKKCTKCKLYFKAYKFSCVNTYKE